MPAASASMSSCGRGSPGQLVPVPDSLACIYDDQQIEAIDLGRGRPQTIRQRSGGDDRRPSARIPQQMRLVIERVRRVGGHWHRADRHQSGLGDRKFRPVFHAEHDPVASRNTRRTQVSRAGRCHSAELAPGDGMPTAIAPRPQHRLVRPTAGQGEHHRGQVRPCRVALHASSGAGQVTTCPLMLLLPSVNPTDSAARLYPLALNLVDRLPDRKDASVGIGPLDHNHLGCAGPIMVWIMINAFGRSARRGRALAYMDQQCSRPGTPNPR